MKADQKRGLKVYIDGAARGNPGPAGIGVVVKEDNGEKIVLGAYIGETTNNVAEYTALLSALEIPEVREAEVIDLYSDSELLVRQLNGFYKVKSRNLQQLFQRAKEQLARFSRVSVNYIPREENTTADELANRAIDRVLQGRGEGKAGGPFFDTGQEKLF